MDLLGGKHWAVPPKITVRQLHSGTPGPVWIRALASYIKLMSFSAGFPEKSTVPLARGAEESMIWASWPVERNTGCRANARPLNSITAWDSWRPDVFQLRIKGLLHLPGYKGTRMRTNAAMVSHFQTLTRRRPHPAGTTRRRASGIRRTSQT